MQADVSFLSLITSEAILAKIEGNAEAPATLFEKGLELEKEAAGSVGEEHPGLP